MKLHSYLILNGNCADSFAFYEKVLGGKIEAMLKFSDMPKGDQSPEACDGPEQPQCHCPCVPEGRGPPSHGVR